jgi:hypothetical protein
LTNKSTPKLQNDLVKYLANKAKQELEKSETSTNVSVPVSTVGGGIKTNKLDKKKKPKRKNDKVIEIDK